ncbi:MAG: endonuclease III [Candidatus Micrarchaeota archaeon]
MILKNLGNILKQMQFLAKKRKAPVISAEDSTKGNKFKILVFTMLSARTKDQTTIAVVNRLFSQAKGPKEIIKLGPKKLEKILYGVGFYRVKTKNLLKMCNLLKDGQVPDSLEDLLKIPGVGRKTANIVLARAFGKNTLGVDVHVHRISNRLGLVKTKKPEETEEKLMKIIPDKYIRKLNKTFVSFGQTVCLPRNPDCLNCPISDCCPKIGIF